MNDHDIENLLRKAPSPSAPAGLKEQLQADITLTRSPAPQRTAPVPGVSFWRRWFPAVAFSVVFLTCFVLLGVQTTQLVQMRRENAALRAATANLEELRAQAAHLEKLRVQARQLERLQKDAVELQQLRAEVAKLRPEGAELVKLRADQQRLKADLAARAAQAAAVSLDEDPFAEQKKKAQSIACVNNLKQIGLAARLWANDHQDVLPPDFQSMTRQLSTPKILVCPGDTARAELKVSNWADFNPQNVSYQILSPGVADKYPDVVYAVCPIHGHLALVDGSVQGNSASRIVDQNGRKVFSR